MKIRTKFDIGSTVYYLERRYVEEQCATCKGKKKINVTNGMNNWNIKCPDCNGKGKQSQVIRYVVTSGIIKEVIAKRGNYALTKYHLENGIHKQETALFAELKDAEEKCCALNANIIMNGRN